MGKCACRHSSWGGAQAWEARGSRFKAPHDYAADLRHAQRYVRLGCNLPCTPIIGNSTRVTANAAQGQVWRRACSKVCEHMRRRSHKRHATRGELLSEAMPRRCKDAGVAVELTRQQEQRMCLRCGAAQHSARNCPTRMYEDAPAAAATAAAAAAAPDVHDAPSIGELVPACSVFAGAIPVHRVAVMVMLSCPEEWPCVAWQAYAGIFDGWHLRLFRRE